MAADVVATAAVVKAAAKASSGENPLPPFAGGKIVWPVIGLFHRPSANHSDCSISQRGWRAGSGFMTARLAEYIGSQHDEMEYDRKQAPALLREIMR